MGRGELLCWVVDKIKLLAGMARAETDKGQLGGAIRS